MSRGGLTAAAAAALATARPALPVRRWDHKTPPARLALLERRFALTAAEREHLLRDGFVVPERLADTDYALALHEVFQSQLPLFISADAILHAIYASNDKLLARLEGTVLAPRLKLDDLQGRALMIHSGADNHADHPAPLGGGGARVGCGVAG